MRPRFRRRSLAPRGILVAVLVVALVGPLLVGSAAARPPPRPVCGACGDAVVDAGTVESSAVTIRVDGTGTGHWTARTVVEDPDRLDRERVRAAARRALDGTGGFEDARDLRVTVEGDAVVVRFSVPDVAHRSVGGVLVVDRFYWAGDSARWYRIDADRVTLRGPEGTAVTEAPAGATVEDGAVVWTAGEGAVGGGSIPETAFVAFAPDDGVGSSLATHLGIGLDVAGAKLPDLGAAALPVLVLSAVLGLLWRLRGRVAGWSLPRRAAFGVGLGAGLAAAAVVVAGVTEALMAGTSLADGLVGAALATLLFGGIAAGAVVAVAGAAVALQYGLVRVVGPRLDPGRRSLALAGLPLGVAALAWLFAPVAAGSDAPLADGYAVFVHAAAALSFLPLGAAAGSGDGRDGRDADGGPDRAATPATGSTGAWIPTAGSPGTWTRRVLAATVVCAPALAVLGAAPFGGFFETYRLTAFVPSAVAVGVLGTLAFALGQSTDRDGSGGPATDAPGGVDASGGSDPDPDPDPVE